ncbi:unnamed protein product, partial [Mesorhabditis belari]|uniref:Uncharacterized protein n=1 Tax=Mesorhabditis belari TaxID=2138241 RepID=A0AAF3EJY3_9BILA
MEPVRLATAATFLFSVLILECRGCDLVLQRFATFVVVFASISARRNSNIFEASSPPPASPPPTPNFICFSTPLSRPLPNVVFALFGDPNGSHSWQRMGRLHRNDDSFASSSRDKEESFNRQATHDLIYENYNISNRDHNDFPGVVPRTFVGPFALTSFGFPLRIVFWLFGIQKIWMLFAVCLFLGAAVVISFCNFCRWLSPPPTANFICFSTPLSRPLPNVVFALFRVLFVLQKWFDGQHQSGRTFWK